MQAEIIPHLFRTEYRKIVSVLYKLFGLEHIEIAEDIVSDVFLLATETWGLKGLPENPTAWLYHVSKNRTKDHLKRDLLFRKKIQADLKGDGDFEEARIDFSSQNIADSQLQMMFAICSPSLPQEAQIGLSLRILCGFGIEEIAAAFLTNKETINKRLFRAKEKLRSEKIKIEFPPATEIIKRLETVATTLYLLFNEGYYSSIKDTKLSKELCLEAMRLTHLLIENEITDKPFINALLSLMCFHASRFEARINAEGENILYADQDVNLWNKELIAQGDFFLRKAAKGKILSKYHLEAGIARCHTVQTDSEEKWETILQLYNYLLQIEYSPVTALNRTYALYKAKGKNAALAEAEKLELKDNPLYFSLLGELYSGIDREKAVASFESALKTAKTAADRQAISVKLSKLDRRS